METTWTDDIPICRATGIGSVSNEIYRKDGRRVEMHPMRSRHFSFTQDEYHLSLYGLFDGFSGSQVSEFAMKRMPAELVLGQLNQHSPDEAVRDALRQTFLLVDRQYFESIIESIAYRIVLKQENVSHNDSKLKQLEDQAQIGCSATVALILNRRLFVANVGDTRAVLCSQGPRGELKVTRLSVEHVLGNEDEELRLNQLGLSTNEAERALSKFNYTRCLGYHDAKGGYSEVAGLKAAKDEPVSSEPEIHGPVQLDPSFQFLLIFSRSVADCLSQVTSSDGGDVNHELCRIAMEQFSENPTVTGVAQSVVDKIVRMHREQFEMETTGGMNSYTSREDMSLMLRNFNAKLGVSRRKKSSMSASEASNTSASGAAGVMSMMRRQPEDTITSKTTTTEGSDVFVGKNVRELPVDAEGRIKPYVDFSYFNREYAKAQAAPQNGI